MIKEGQITGAEAASFKAPNRFSHTGTERAGSAPLVFSALHYDQIESGAPKDKPSYYRRTYGGNYGVQVRDATRNDQGYRTFEEVRK